jgi:hypothetical protein
VNLKNDNKSDFPDYELVHQSNSGIWAQKEQYQFYDHSNKNLKQIRCELKKLIELT